MFSTLAVYASAPSICSSGPNPFPAPQGGKGLPTVDFSPDLDPLSTQGRARHARISSSSPAALDSHCAQANAHRSHDDAAIFFTAIAFNLFGDGLRDALDPRLKTSEDLQIPGPSQEACGMKAQLHTHEQG